MCSTCYRIQSIGPGSRTCYCVYEVGGQLYLSTDTHACFPRCCFLINRYKLIKSAYKGGGGERGNEPVAFPIPMSDEEKAEADLKRKEKKAETKEAADPMMEMAEKMMGGMEGGPGELLERMRQGDGSGGVSEVSTGAPGMPGGGGGGAEGKLDPLDPSVLTSGNLQGLMGATGGGGAGNAGGIAGGTAGGTAVSGQKKKILIEEIGAAGGSGDALSPETTDATATKAATVTTTATTSTTPRSRFCEWCCKEHTTEHLLLGCTRCNLVVYCDEECQKIHWMRHRPDCVAAYWKANDIEICVSTLVAYDHAALMDEEDKYRHGVDCFMVVDQIKLNKKKREEEKDAGNEKVEEEEKKRQ